MAVKATEAPPPLPTNISFASDVVPIFSKGEYPDGRKVSNQGILPFEVQYVEKPGDKKFATKPTDYITGIPTVYNADTLGIRPDLVKRKIESWAEFRRKGMFAGPRTSRCPKALPSRGSSR